MARMALRFGRTLVVLAALVPQAVAAQDPDDPDNFVWENESEVSFVATSGNQQSSAFGLKSVFEGKNANSGFKFDFGGVRASSTFTTLTAEGTPGDFIVNRMERSETSAESYYARGRYDHDLGDAAFLFAGAGWERNTFAGFDNRYSAVVGVGKAWIDTETRLLKTDVGVTYTVQKDIEDDPELGDGFVGLRASIEARRDLSESTTVSSMIVIDENLRETEDLRVDATASLSVDLTEGLAFKTTYQIQFDNDPALVGVPLFTGGVANGTVLTPTDDIDSFLTLSLVIKL